MSVFPPSGPQIPSMTTTPPSPTGNPPVRYRVEERTRTIYVTSDVPPARWQSRSLGSLFPQEGNVAEPGPRQRTKSKVQTQYIITGAESPSQPRSAPPVLTMHRSRQSNPPSPLQSRQPNPPSPLQSRQSNPPSPLQPSPTRSPRGPRPRILFYHKHDPHYGFTNFSPHAVKYNGKVYPTSEHLFQSFKVRGGKDCPE